jgi:hypothetical protein
MDNDGNHGEPASKSVIRGLPLCFLPFQTCHRLWKVWLGTVAFEQMLQVVCSKAARDLMATVRRTGRPPVADMLQQADA